MSSLESLDDSYRAFWAKREEIKARHRTELEAELAPQRRDLQRDIFKVQADFGYTVSQVAETIGNTRNFVYLIRNDKPLIETDPEKRAAQKSVTTRIRPMPGEAKRKQTTVTDIAIQLSETDTHAWTYTIDRAEKTVEVWESPGLVILHHYQTDALGYVTVMPDAWTDMDLSKPEKDFFRKIVQDIESVIEPE